MGHAGSDLEHYRCCSLLPIAPCRHVSAIDPVIPKPESCPGIRMSELISPISVLTATTAAVHQCLQCASHISRVDKVPVQRLEVRNTSYKVLRIPKNAHCDFALRCTSSPKTLAALPNAVGRYTHLDENPRADDAGRVSMYRIPSSSTTAIASQHALYAISGMLIQILTKSRERKHEHEVMTKGLDSTHRTLHNRKRP